MYARICWRSQNHCIISKRSCDAPLCLTYSIDNFDEECIFYSFCIDNWSTCHWDLEEIADWSLLGRFFFFLMLLCVWSDVQKSLSSFSCYLFLTLRWNYFKSKLQFCWHLLTLETLSFFRLFFFFFVGMLMLREGIEIRISHN